MPSSCTSTVSPDLALCAGAAGPLDLTSAQTASAGAAASDPFDLLLTQAGTPVEPQTPAEHTTQSAPLVLSAEQLAFLAAWASPAPQTPPAVNDAQLAEGDGSWVRSTAPGQSLSELLGQGAERISYTLGANSQGTAAGTTQPHASAANPEPQASTSAAENALQATAEATAAKTAVQASAERGHGSSSKAQSMSAADALATSAAASKALGPEEVAAAGDSAAAQMLNPPVNTPPPKNLRTAFSLREKFAAGEAVQASAGGFPSGGTGKMQTEVTGSEQVTNSTSALGTSAAIWGKLMPNDSRNTLDFPPQPGAAGAMLETGSAHSATAGRSEAASQPVSQALELVREIGEIADGLAQVERNSVEVEFDFGSRERLSVRVEYRDGVVQATFKTDSPELRDAIAREWRQSAGNEARPYRMADPVFTSSGFSFSGDASRHQRSQEQAAPFQPAHAFAASRGSSAVTSSPIPSTPVQRPARAGHLHAIV